jgi:hypothetical protein
MHRSDDATSTEATNIEDMTGTALPWRAYPEPLRTTTTATVSPLPVAWSAASPGRWRPSSISALGCGGEQ